MSNILPESSIIQRRKTIELNKQFDKVFTDCVYSTMDSTYDIEKRIKKDFRVELASNQLDLVEAIVDLDEKDVCETDARSGGKTFGAIIGLSILSIDNTIKIGITAPTDGQANRIINTLYTEVIPKSDYLRNQINWKLSTNTRVVFKHTNSVWESFSGSELASAESRHYDMLLCFPKGTKILLSDGSNKNIEDIKDGDVVITCDMKTMQLKSEPVLGKIRNESEELIEIAYEVDGQTKMVRCTPSHRIITARGEIPAEDLKTEDEIYGIM